MGQGRAPVSEKALHANRASGACAGRPCAKARPVTRGVFAPKPRRRSLKASRKGTASRAQAPERKRCSIRASKLECSTHKRCGTSKAAIEEYVAGIAAVLARSKATLRRGAPVCIVVNDRRGLYPEILDRAGLRLDERLERHVNRRTGRRSGEYFESILVCR